MLFNPSSLRKHDLSLCIVNRRDDARALWELMPEGTFHLSALMCGAHRSKKIAEIKQSQKDGLATRVISTQLVEAGVDVDFPVVYRALAGLDSVAQAAGRCNREGLQDKGDVYIFAPPSKIPAGHLRQAAEIGRRLLERAGHDPLSRNSLRFSSRSSIGFAAIGLIKKIYFCLRLSPGLCRRQRSSARSCGGASVAIASVWV